MLTVTRKYRREVQRERRPLVLEVEMVGGSVLVGVREKGRRRGYMIEVARLYVTLAERAAADRRARRLGRKRTRVGG